MISNTVYIISKDSLMVNRIQNLLDTTKISPDSTTVSDTFFGNSGITIHPEMLLHASHDWLLYLLLFMLATVAVVHFFVSGKISEIVSNVFSFKTIRRKLSEGSSFSSGLALNILFFLNFLVAVTVLFYLNIQIFIPSLFTSFSQETLFFTILLLVFVYISGIRFLMTFVDFMLGLNTLMRLHIQISTNIEFLAGIIFLPFILLFIYTSSSVWLLIATVFLLFFLLFKWVQLLIFGIKIAGISPFHLFLYLCTLEMVPLLVTIKLLGFDGYL